MGHMTLIWVTCLCYGTERFIYGSYDFASYIFAIGQRGSYMGHMTLIGVLSLFYGTVNVIYGSYDFDIGHISLQRDIECHIWVI